MLAAHSRLAAQPHAKVPMKKIFGAGALALSLNLATAAAPTRRLVPLLDAATIANRCEPELTRLRAMVRDMEGVRGAGNILGEFNRIATGRGRRDMPSGQG
jgi:hypothetical protein